jgi:16S rRNA G1207 methylase RsmC
MKISHILIASAALAVGPAIAQDTAAPEAGADCASLQAQWDQTASTASAEQLSSVQASVDEGKKLCAEGKTAEGAAKLQEALSAISQPSAMPSEQPAAEQPPMEQPPTDTEQPPQ